MKKSKKQKAKSKKKKHETLNAIDQEERQIDMQLKKLEVEEKSAQITGWENRRIINEEQMTSVGIIDSLRWLLEATTIDEDRSLPGMEPVYRPVFDDREQAVIRKKILELVAKL